MLAAVQESNFSTIDIEEKLYTGIHRGIKNEEHTIQCSRDYFTIYAVI